MQIALNSKADQGVEHPK